MPARIPKDKEAEVLKQAESKLPEGDQILFERVVEKDTGREYRIPYLVKKRVMLTGDVLSDARVSIGQFNDPYVSITFERKGGGSSIGSRAKMSKSGWPSCWTTRSIRLRSSRSESAADARKSPAHSTTQEANDLAIVLAGRRVAGAAEDHPGSHGWSVLGQGFD